jgi:hypothetical protein
LTAAIILPQPCIGAQRLMPKSHHLYSNAIMVSGNTFTSGSIGNCRNLNNRFLGLAAMSVKSPTLSHRTREGWGAAFVGGRFPPS